MMTEDERNALVNIVTGAIRDYYATISDQTVPVSRLAPAAVAMAEVIVHRIVATDEFYYLPQKLGGE